MNYKLSDREKNLLKILSFVFLIFIVFLFETRLINKLTESKKTLLSKIQIFNTSKQQLAQLKEFEDKRVSATSLFLAHLESNNYLYENKSNRIEVTILSETKAIELLNFIGFHKLRINSMEMKLTEGEDLIMSINFDN